MHHLHGLPGILQLLEFLQPPIEGLASATEPDTEDAKRFRAYDDRHSLVSVVEFCVSCFTRAALSEVTRSP